LELCDQFGLRSTTPREPFRRGGHLAVCHPDAQHLVTQLAERGVIMDFRDPDTVRIGCSPLTTRFTDVFDGLSSLAGLV
jgi:kynureninase